MRGTGNYCMVNDNLIVILNYVDRKQFRFDYAISDRSLTLDSSSTLTRFGVHP